MIRRHQSNQSKKFLFWRKIRSSLIILLVTFCLAVIIFILSLISSWKYLTLINIKISGVEPDKIEIIHSDILESLKGKYFGLFSRANILIYPKRSIQKNILEIHKETDTVTIKRENFHSISLSIEEKKPAAIICPNFPDFLDGRILTDSLNSCYYSDDRGQIFKRVFEIPKLDFNLYFIPELNSINNSTSSSDAIIGLYATSTKEFILIQKLYSIIKANKISVEAVLIKSASEYELYAVNPVIVTTNDKIQNTTFIIYLNTSLNPEDQVSNLVSFWQDALKKARGKNRNPEFIYLDPRYGNNVFYREVK